MLPVAFNPATFNNLWDAGACQMGWWTAYGPGAIGSLRAFQDAIHYFPAFRRRPRSVFNTGWNWNQKDYFDKHVPIVFKAPFGPARFQRSLGRRPVARVAVRAAQKRQRFRTLAAIIAAGVDAITVWRHRSGMQ